MTAAADPFEGRLRPLGAGLRAKEDARGVPAPRVDWYVGFDGVLKPPGHARLTNTQPLVRDA